MIMVCKSISHRWINFIILPSPGATVPPSGALVGACVVGLLAVVGACVLTVGPTVSGFTGVVELSEVTFGFAIVVGGTGWAVLVGAFMVGVGGSVIMSEVIIRKTCQRKVYPLIPHFYIARLGFAGIYLLFLFLIQNIDCWIVSIDCRQGRF